MIFWQGQMTLQTYYKTGWAIVICLVWRRDFFPSLANHARLLYDPQKKIWQTKGKARNDGP